MTVPSLFTAAQLSRLSHNAHLAEADHVPVAKLFNPCGAATWLVTELDEDGDTLFGLADMGFGCPELGRFSLAELQSLRLPFGLTIERDRSFRSRLGLSVWADTARAAGSISAAEQKLAGMEAMQPIDHPG